MDTSQKYISIDQQKILLDIFKNGHINFSTQKIYKNRKSFNRALNIFYRLEWLNKKSIRLNGHYANDYSLTVEGKLIINYTLKKMIL